MSSRIKYALWWCLVMSAHLIIGQTDDHVSIMRRIHIVPDNEMIVYNPGYLDPQGLPGEELYKAEYTAVVELIYGREKLSDVEGDEWGFRVEYDLQDENNLIIHSGQVIIQVFENNTTFLDQQRFILPSGYTKLIIKEIYHTDDAWQTESQDLLGIINNIPDDIRLELRVEGERYDYLDVDAQILGLELTEQDNTLQIKWNHLVGAETYQVEWGFETQYLHALAEPSNHFANPVRVETINNYYNLPITYPEGMLYVRARAVGRHIRGVVNNPSIQYHQRPGVWSNEESIAIGFEPDHHWQATTSYAEEGKFKKVLEYFDDGLKNRQMATTLSTDSIVLRSSVLYDFEGRPVITVLPAPDLASKSLEFVSGLNALPPTIFEDNNETHELPSTNGAGLYYSSNNPATLGLHSQYIADAEGFPYTRMKYLNDGTGRVQSQSGIGALYKLGTGRETTYFYDDPSETQLRRLFGKNVGTAKYYKRNIVQDPNGQLMVSYVDIAGNTIATALAGESPSNVRPLQSQQTGTTDIIENLIENNVVDTTTGVSRVVTTLFNEQEGLTYSFNYSLTGLINEYAEDICLSCKYALVFDIKDPCGDSVYSNTVYLSGGDLCNDTIFGHTLALPIFTFDSIGLYTISKTLSIIPLTIEEWMIALNSILPDSAYFAELYLSQIDTTECIQSCDQYCRDKLFALYGEEWDEEELQDSIEACIFHDCLDTLFSEGPMFLCDAIHTQMIFQLQEGGCYHHLWYEDSTVLSGLTFIKDEEEVPGLDMYAILKGNQIWEDSWADTLALIHPDSCCYNFCVSMVKSRKFDLEMSFLYTWSNVSDDVTFFLDIDPFFVTGGPGFSYVDEMKHALEYFGTNEDVGGNLDSCDIPYPTPVSLIDFIECILGDSTDEVKWESYVSIYSGLKEEWVKAASCNGAGNESCTACLEVPDNFTEIDTVDEGIDFANIQLDSLCGDVCMGQATMIANILYETCDSIAWQELYDTLYNHCIMVCSWQNPLGMFLEEDLETPSLEAVLNWLNENNCDVHLFDSLIIVPFDSVYIPLGFPQNAGISITDTICIGDSINLFVLHDSLYIASLDSLYADSLLGEQMFLMDTGLYYFIGFDSLCCQLLDTTCSSLDSALFTWYNDSMVWAPWTIMGAWPQLSFTIPGCYTFGFYAPSMPGACSEYSEVTLYIPGCDEPELVIDSLGECISVAHLNFGPHTGPIDTIIWTVNIDGVSGIPYTEGDTLFTGSFHMYEVQIIYEMCCDTLVLTGGVDCSCETCAEQFVDLCPFRFFGFVSIEGDTLYVVDFQPSCDSAWVNDELVEGLEILLQSLDPCGMPEVSWSFIDGDSCECVRITIAGSSIVFDYIYGASTFYFDTTGCDSILIRSTKDPITSIDSNIDSTGASIKIYPNPTKTSFYLEFNHSYLISNYYTVQVTDFSGTLFFSQQFASDGSFDKVLIEPLSIPPGVYQVIVKDDFGYYSTTIVIML
jgi:hypothetical protein